MGRATSHSFPYLRYNAPVSFIGMWCNAAAFRGLLFWGVSCWGGFFPLLQEWLWGLLPQKDLALRDSCPVPAQNGSCFERFLHNSCPKEILPWEISTQEGSCFKRFLPNYCRKRSCFERYLPSSWPKGILPQEIPAQFLTKRDLALRGFCPEGLLHRYGFCTREILLKRTPAQEASGPRDLLPHEGSSTV